MTDSEFDAALVSAAFAQAALTGWPSLSIVEAARAAGLPLDRARARFPGPAAVLMRFGVIADQAALAEPVTEPRARDRLFDLLMRRFDVLQQHRDGMAALLRALPVNPGLALALGAATLRSMGWMLEAAGVSATGWQGRLRANGLVAVWLYALRAWKDDDSADLAATMAAMDKALDQAERVSSMFGLDARTPSEDAVQEPADAPAEAAALDVDPELLVQRNPQPPTMPEPPASPP